MLPAPVALPGDTRVGFGAGVAAGPGISEECRLERAGDGIWEEICTPRLQGVTHVSPSTWVLIEVAPRVEVGGTAGLGYLGGGFVGVFGRVWALEAERLRLGVHLEGGLAWLGAGIPLSVGLGRGVWLYTQPNVAVAFSDFEGEQGMPEWRAPMGLSVDLSQLVRLSGEMMVAYVPTRLEDRYLGIETRGAVAISFHPPRAR